MGSGKSVLYQFSAETPAAEIFTNCKSVNCSKMTSPLRDVFCNRDVASSHLVKDKMNRKISKSFWRLVSSSEFLAKLKLQILVALHVFCNRDVASSHLVKVKMNQKISKSFWRLVSSSEFLAKLKLQILVSL